MNCNRCGREMKGTTAYDGACECGGLVSNSWLLGLSRAIRVKPVGRKVYLLEPEPDLTPSKVKKRERDRRDYQRRKEKEARA